MPHYNTVIPAQACRTTMPSFPRRRESAPTDTPHVSNASQTWIPAYAGMTEKQRSSSINIPHHTTIIPAQAGIHADRCTDVSKNIQNLDPRLREDDEKAALFHHRHTALQYRYPDDDIPHDNTVDSREGTRHHNTVIPGKALSTTIPSFPRRRESNLKVYHHVRYV